MPPSAYYVDADTAHDALRARGMFNAVDMASGWNERWVSDLDLSDEWTAARAAIV